MLDMRIMAGVVILGLSVGLAGGWWVWGRSADVPTQVMALLEDHCLPAMTDDTAAGLDDRWTDAATGAWVSLRKPHIESDPTSISCSVMELDQRWSDASKERLVPLLDQWAYGTLGPLTDGKLVTVDSTGGKAVPPSMVWRRQGAGLSYYLYIYTHDEGRVTVVSAGRATFPDTAEKTGRIINA